MKYYDFQVNSNSDVLLQHRYYAKDETTAFVQFLRDVNNNVGYLLCDKDDIKSEKYASVLFTMYTSENYRVEKMCDDTVCIDFDI